MKSNPNDKKTRPISLPEVLLDELRQIKGNDFIQTNDGQLNGAFENLHKAQLSALCFSGGGIRSATFGLGIVQSLAKHGKLDKFDYLSTVSGGGYLGSWLSAWIRREQLNALEKRVTKLESLKNKISDKLENPNLSSPRKAQLLKLREKVTESAKKENNQLFEDYKKSQKIGIKTVQDELNRLSIPKSDATCPNIEPKQLQYLREYSNYMSPKVGLLSADTWTLAGIYTRNLFLNWTIFIPLICAILLIPRILLAFVNSNGNATALTVVLLGGLLVGIVAVFFTVSKMPGKNIYFPRKKPKIDLNEETGKQSQVTLWEKVNKNTDLGVFLSVILPMLIMAFAATTYWAWYKKPGILSITLFNRFPAFLDHEIIYFIVFSAAIFVIGNFIFYLFKFLLFTLLLPVLSADV
jgi:Patatin-like phospholipase